MPETWTRYAIFDHKPDKIHEHDWRPWKTNTQDDIELTRRIVIHRFIRDRGGLDGLQTVHLYEHEHGAPTHQNGRPLAVNYITYDIKKNPK